MRDFVSQFPKPRMHDFHARGFPDQLPHGCGWKFFGCGICASRTPPRRASVNPTALRHVLDLLQLGLLRQFRTHEARAF